MAMFAGTPCGRRDSGHVRGNPAWEGSCIPVGAGAPGSVHRAPPPSDQVVVPKAARKSWLVLLPSAV